MPDPYEPLPDDDESIDALTADAHDYMRSAVSGWEPSTGAPEVAIIAAAADEQATVYTLLRDDEADRYADFGREIVGLAEDEPTPATTTTTWVARDAAGYTIEAGQQIIVNAPAGPIGFELPQEAVIPAGDTELAGVLVQAINAGSQATGATGPVEFDEQPAWVAGVTVDAPAIGGTDGEDEDTYRARVRGRTEQWSLVPIHPIDFELAAQESPEVARALVLRDYDDTTGLSDQERTVSIYPVDIAGAAVSAGVRAAVQARIESRREVNWVVRLGTPTYTTVNVAVTVAATETADHADLAVRVAAAISDNVISPAMWGQPTLGERRSWRQRTVVRQSDIAAAAKNIEGVDYVDDPVLINATDANLTLTGAAPLPVAGTVTVTVLP